MKISIGKKIFLSFLMLNLFVFSLMLLLFFNLFQENNMQNIKFDMEKTRNDINSYINWFVSDNEIGLFNTISERKEELLTELNTKLGVRGVIYNLEGIIILGENSCIDIFRKKDDDLNLALKGGAAYTIFEKERLAAFSVPVVIGGEKIFVYRLEKDYSRIFETGNYYSRIILMFGGLSLLFVSIISFIISKAITKPIIKLKEVTNKIAAQDYEVDVEVNSKDEIGDLAYNFKIMQIRVKDHIGTIKKDKDLLKELLDQRKRFFDSVTHELKTPLTVIQGYTQMLADNGFEDEDFFSKGTTHIIEESIRLHKLVLSLLELSELSSANSNSKCELLDVSSLLEKVCDAMEIKARNNEISIRKSITRELKIYGCYDDLKGLFSNLIDNSIKYAGEKSTIEVITSDRVNYIEIIVRDNGIGISKDKLEKVFEPFYRINNKKSREIGSSGLGLSIVKKIVENHGGSINIESDENAGTSVTVILPKNQSV